MKIGFVGLGKLGLPVALATESKGHEVRGYDPSNHVTEIIDTRKLPYMEAGFITLISSGAVFLSPIPVTSLPFLISIVTSLASLFISNVDNGAAT